MFGLINWDELKKGEASNFHGDLQFDNIILKDNGEFLLIDWRQDFSGNLEYGDKYYDLAKLNGGIIVSYRVIKQGKFSFSEDMKGNVEISNEKPKELTISQKIFHKYIKEKKFDKTKIDLLTSLIYLNMSPMHNKPFDHFIYNFGKLSLYKTLLASGKILP